VSGVGRSRPALAAGMGVCLGTLSGLPPSPIFASELLIVAGGFQAGHATMATAAALLLALAFVGLNRSLLETTTGDAPSPIAEVTRTATRLPGLGSATSVTVASGVLLVALLGVSIWLPASQLAAALTKGVS